MRNYNKKIKTKRFIPKVILERQYNFVGCFISEYRKS